MKKIILPGFFLLVMSMHLNAQSNNSGLDTLKKDIKAIGNLFKKAANVNISIDSIEQTDNNLTQLKQNILHTMGVKKLDEKYSTNNVVLTVSCKSKALELWSDQPLNSKQAFSVMRSNDTSLQLQYKYKKVVVQKTVAPAASPVIANQQTNNNITKTEVIAPPQTTGLTAVAALLFKGVQSKLKDVEKNKIADSLQFILTPDKKEFAYEDAAEFPFGAELMITDMNKDGKEEVFVTFGNSYTSGNTGTSVALFIADKNGIYRPNLGFPGVTPDILKTVNLGYPDLMIGGPGFQFPVWRWNGKEYIYYKTVKQ